MKDSKFNFFRNFLNKKHLAREKLPKFASLLFTACESEEINGFGEFA